MSQSNTCDCHTRENDVCPNCLDSTLDDIWKSMVEGTAGRNSVDQSIAVKEMLMTIIKNPDFIMKTQLEIATLRILREKQQTD